MDDEFNFENVKVSIDFKFLVEFRKLKGKKLQIAQNMRFLNFFNFYKI